MEWRRAAVLVVMVWAVATIVRGHAPEIFAFNDGATLAMLGDGNVKTVALQPFGFYEKTTCNASTHAREMRDQIRSQVLEQANMAREQANMARAQVREVRNQKNEIRNQMREQQRALRDQLRGQGRAFGEQFKAQGAALRDDVNAAIE